MRQEAWACLRHLLIDVATGHKYQLIIATFFSNHDPHVNYDDLEIVGDYCGEWDGLHLGQKPKK